MKHCAKKLLGLAFALALCLAVGGTALAETPESANVPAALPEQEMLAFEPYAAPAAGENIATGDGYTVTIPTTVTVNSGENTAKLPVKAQLKQWRTLKIGIASDHNWNLQHESAQAQAQVGYTLSMGTDDYEMGTAMAYYDPDSKILLYKTAALQTTDPKYDSTANARNFTTNFSVEVPTPSQATMSGTYSDRLTFTFNITKQSVTYTINVYGQNITTKADGRANVESVVTPGTTTDGSTRTEGTVDASKVKENTYTETYTMEYGFAGDTLAGAAPGPWTHTQPEAGDERTSIKNTVTTFTDESAADYKRCWETLSQQTIDPQTDYEAGIRNVTINLNLVRKWYWLDVNGATDYTGGSDQESNGNQGGRISGRVNIKVSADNGATWAKWFWYKDGDDYWEQLPYGIRFKLGLHHVKNGYVYDTGPSGGVKIIANKQETETAPGEEEGDTTYYVYEGTLTGEPTGEDLYHNLRYCYIPCYKKGITYFANGGTGGKESVNEANLPRTNVPYNTTDTLQSPGQLLITPPAGMTFAGWSTKPNYTTGTALYTTEQTVDDVTWEPYTAAEMTTRPKNDTDKRELYAIWKYPCTVKVQFGGVIGWTTWDAATQSFPENKQGGDRFDEPAVELGKAYAYRNASLTVSATENTEVWEALKSAINAETSKIASAAAQPENVWQLKNEYTFNSTSPEFTIQIKRKRYLLNVIPALLQSDGSSITPAGDTSQAEQYGKFDLFSCGRPQTLGGKISYYQWMRNYGGSYTINNVDANPGYQFAFFRVIENAPVNKEGASYSSTLTGKNSGISYFGGDRTTYDGDTIYVVFKKDTVTFDFNGGTTQDGKTQTEVQYVPGSYIPQMSLQRTGTFSFKGWSVNKFETTGETIYYPNITQLEDIPWPAPENKVLYARWSNSTVSCNIKIQFENEKGYTDGSATVHEGGSMDDATHTYSVTLENQNVVPGGSWTLDLSDATVPAKVKKAIEDATTEAKSAAQDTDATTADNMFKYKVWKLAEKFVKQGDCSITVPADAKDGQTLTLKIKRRRYLLSVLSTDADTGRIADLVTKDEEKYGTFNVTVNGTKEAEKKSFYQCGWNYGASYTVSNVSAVKEFNSMDMLILKSLAEGDNVTAYASNLKVNLNGTVSSYSSYVTEKQKDIHYYRTDGSVLQDSGGDPVRVIFYNTTATARPRPSRAPAKKALTLRYHANYDPNEELDLDLDPNPLLEDMDDTFGFDPDPLPEDVDDVLEGAVKTVTYQPGEDVVLRNCMFKRGGYVFVGWNTEPDGTGILYRVNGVPMPITDWAAGDTVDLYAQWKKPGHLKPVVDDEPFVPADPDTPPEWVDDVFGVDPAQPEGMDDAFGVDPAAQPEGMDDAFGVDPALPDELDDAFSV